MIFIPGQRGSPWTPKETCPGWGRPYPEQEQIGAGQQRLGREGEAADSHWGWGRFHEQESPADWGGLGEIWGEVRHSPAEAARGSAVCWWKQPVGTDLVDRFILEKKVLIGVCAV